MDTHTKIWWTIMFFSIGGTFLLITITVKEENNQCFLKYQGKPHVSEKIFATTKDGCVIRKVTKEDENCNEIGFVYLTNCNGSITWKTGKVDQATNITVGASN